MLRRQVKLDEFTCNARVNEPAKARPPAGERAALNRSSAVLSAPRGCTVVMVTNSPRAETW